MSRREEFLKLFNDLERYLRIEYSYGKYSESSFMGTLYKIRAKKSNALIGNKANFDTLSQAAQLRNIMVHNENIAVPSEIFLNEFKSIVKKITHPKKIYQVMMPIHKMKVVSLDSSIEEVMLLMKTEDYSNVPVVYEEALVGVFTERTLFHFFALKKDVSIGKDMKMKELLEAMDLDYDPAKYFAFIKRSADIYEALDLFNRDFKEDKELEMLFVTENGLSSEKILGIVTLWDLEHAFM
ncbi:MAG: CBS domain-containing protein [Firmicutes bacterium]|nr:CBS domain-containing protein [Bacillota bacterium]